MTTRGDHPLRVSPRSRGISVRLSLARP